MKDHKHKFQWYIENPQEDNSKKVIKCSVSGCRISLDDYFEELKRLILQVASSL